MGTGPLPSAALWLPARVILRSVHSRIRWMHILAMRGKGVSTPVARHPPGVKCVPQQVMIIFPAPESVQGSSFKYMARLLGLSTTEKPQ